MKAVLGDLPNSFLLMKDLLVYLPNLLVLKAFGDDFLNHKCLIR